MLAKYLTSARTIGNWGKAYNKTCEQVWESINILQYFFFFFKYIYMSRIKHLQLCPEECKRSAISIPNIQIFTRGTRFILHKYISTNMLTFIHQINMSKAEHQYAYQSIMSSVRGSVPT